MAGCNQQSTMVPRVKSMASDVYKDSTTASSLLYMMPVVTMFGASSSVKSGRDSENIAFGSEWGINGKSSSKNGHLVKVSGPRVKYFFLLLAGQYKEADDYLDRMIAAKKDDDDWSHSYHDECVKIADDIKSDLLDVKKMMKKDENSQING